ncbi:hypothetical protein [Runella slithyformis]|uniref:Lipocalin-like domain-containing protein n=1 Tax=Runella slithyformis (strain ATCC 29530 / DSM 19594 / LMG 11500 / NCIMB 11436 / LSU 4) TaxID=761193 RepID=A0A7U3ZI08_RUNSL|nr:hypothetical protein [Runella slithyformis]AEI47597.1 hypothetical protein Runsl_1168 [Runella slithyformis DSM 19594]
MRNILLVLFLTVLFSCREKKLSPEDIQPLVGTWRLEAVEPAEEVNRWEIVPLQNAYYFKVRYDGVILDANGLPTCCAPKYLKTGKKVFLIEPKEAISQNPQCALVLCLACDTWNMDLQGDTLIVSYCEGNGRNRFVRM